MKIKSKRNLIIILGVLFLAVGSTLAFFKNSTILDNIFNSGGYKTIAHEEFVSPDNWMPGDTTEKTVTVTNEGTNPVNVRICVEDYWIAPNGDRLPNHDYTNNIDVAIINEDNISDWAYFDGCYYYHEELDPNETTSSPIQSVTFNPAYRGTISCHDDQTTGDRVCESVENSYDNGVYHLNLRIETIQPEGISEWGIGYSTTGNDYSFPTAGIAQNETGYDTFLMRSLSNGEIVNSIGFIKNNQEYNLSEKNTFEENKEIVKNVFGEENCEIISVGGPKTLADGLSGYTCSDDNLEVQVTEYGIISITSFKNDSALSCNLGSSTGGSGGDRTLIRTISSNSDMGFHNIYCEEKKQGFFVNDDEYYSTIEEFLANSEYKNYKKYVLNNKEWSEYIGFIIGNTEYNFELNYEDDKDLLLEAFGANNCIVDNDNQSCECENETLLIQYFIDQINISSYTSNNINLCLYSFNNETYKCSVEKEGYIAKYSSPWYDDLDDALNANNNKYNSFVKRVMNNHEWQYISGYKNGSNIYYLYSGTTSEPNYTANKLVLNNMFGASNCSDNRIRGIDEYQCQNSSNTISGYADSKGKVDFTSIDKDTYHMVIAGESYGYKIDDKKPSFPPQVYDVDRIYGNNIYRSGIESITIDDNINIPDDAIDAWHISSEPNVLSWYTDRDSNGLYELYIGQMGGVVAKSNSVATFAYFKNVKRIDVSKLKTDYVTDMSVMFREIGKSASSFEIVGLENWNTSNVTDMGGMFYKMGIGAQEVVITGLKDWDTSKVTNMASMFSFGAPNTMTIGSTNVQKFVIDDLSYWDTSNVTIMAEMFSNTGFDSTIWSIGNLSNWDVSNVTNMRSMFFHSGHLASVWNIGNLDNWNISKVTDMESMFYGAGYSDTTWNIGDLSNWDTSKVTTMRSMFCGAGKNATTWSIGNISNWDTSNVTTMAEMFEGAGGNSTIWNSIGTLKVYATNIEDIFSYTKNAKATLNIYSNPTEYSGALNNSSSQQGAGITVNYSNNTTNIDNIIATKSANDNIFKGTLLD